MKKILFLVGSLTIFSLVFTFKSNLIAANEINQDVDDLISIQENIELEKQLEELIKDVPDLDAPSEENKFSTFMTSSKYKPRAGDILYTPSTQCKNNSAKCKGISGHLGLVSITGSNVYHIANTKSKPKSIKKATWFKNYKKTIIVRPKSKSDGEKAARWAYNHYIKGKGKNKTYSLTFSRSVNLKTTYCSLIPFHGYSKGANINILGKTGYLPPANVPVYANKYGFTIHGRVGY